MILSVSRRTDIPCYYSEWFMNRIREGVVLTRNPVNQAQLSRVVITPDIVDGIVFWTKDPANMLMHLDELDRLGFRYYFQFTITPYGNDIERNLRPKGEIEDAFLELSRRIGKERVIWRYDPIILNDYIGMDYHQRQFRRMCEKLAPFTDMITISFMDFYPKLKTMPARLITENEMEHLAGFIGITAKEYGLRATACCETLDLTGYGIKRANCIDKERIEKICGYKLDLPTDKNQRQGCGCFQSIDIGAYDTCMSGCVYCYANGSPATLKHRVESHNPESLLLIGEVKEGENLTDRKVKSNKQSVICQKYH
jgi:hypothetical protein